MRIVNIAQGVINALGVISAQGNKLICNDSNALGVITALGIISAQGVVSTQYDNIAQGVNNTQGANNTQKFLALFYVNLVIFFGCYYRPLGVIIALWALLTPRTILT